MPLNDADIVSSLRQRRARRVRRFHLPTLYRRLIPRITQYQLPSLHRGVHTGRRWLWYIRLDRGAAATLPACPGADGHLRGFGRAAGRHRRSVGHPASERLADEGLWH